MLNETKLLTKSVLLYRNKCHIEELNWNKQNKEKFSCLGPFWEYEVCPYVSSVFLRNPECFVNVFPSDISKTVGESWAGWAGGYKIDVFAFPQQSISDAAPLRPPDFVSAADI